MDTMTLHDGLRAWASGETTLMAATELLIRSGFAQAGNPWIHAEDAGGIWIDFPSIPDRIGALSGGQQRVLRIAASIADDVPVVLGDEITGLDHGNAQLVLAALAHAAGFGEPTTAFDRVDGVTAFVTKPALSAWPAPASS